MTTINSLCEELGVDVKDVEIIKNEYAVFMTQANRSGVALQYEAKGIYWIEISKIKKPLSSETRFKCFVRMHGKTALLREFNQYVFMRNTKLWKALNPT
jgi:hypothetical protein